MTKHEFDWCDYYELAKSYSKEENEAKLRTGISRFYNSCFCMSRNHLLKNKLFLNKKSKDIMNSTSPEVHNATRNIFQKHPNLNYNKKGEKISHELNDLREYRNMVDYDENNPQDIKYAYNSCKSKAKRIFELLNELN